MHIDPDHPNPVSPEPKNTHKVDVVSFVISLMLAPLVIALLGFWLALIPVFAVLFGGVPWLSFGAWFLWLSLKRHGPGPMLIGAALLANLIGTPILTFLFMVISDPTGFTHELWDVIAFMVGFGIVFSGLWGTVFMYLYKWFYRTKNRRTVTSPNQVG